MFFFNGTALRGREKQIRRLRIFAPMEQGYVLQKLLSCLGGSTHSLVVSTSFGHVYHLQTFKYRKSWDILYLDSSSPVQHIFTSLNFWTRFEILLFDILFNLLFHYIFPWAFLITAGMFFSICPTSFGTLPSILGDHHANTVSFDPIFWGFAAPDASWLPPMLNKNRMWQRDWKSHVFQNSHVRSVHLRYASFTEPVLQCIAVHYKATSYNEPM